MASTPAATDTDTVARNQPAARLRPPGREWGPVVFGNDGAPPPKDKRESSGDNDRDDHQQDADRDRDRHNAAECIGLAIEISRGQHQQDLLGRVSRRGERVRRKDCERGLLGESFVC